MYFFAVKKFVKLKINVFLCCKKIFGLLGLYITSEKTISEKWKECRDGKYKHREKRGELLYVDHTINSARGHDEEDVGWWPRAEFMV